MHCRSCGKELSEQAVACTSCGVPPRAGKNFCQNCGAGTNAAAVFCVSCGAGLAEEQTKSKLAAGLLGIFVGGFGVHRFYLGYVGMGIAQVAVTIATCGIGAIWGFIEGILILTDVINKDAKGRPLKE
jgi:TM2 domain-containing membrane protein YozV